MTRKILPYAVLGLAAVGAWYFLVKPSAGGSRYFFDSTFSQGVKDLFRAEGGSAGSASGSQREGV